VAQHSSPQMVIPVGQQRPRSVQAPLQQPSMAQVVVKPAQGSGGGVVAGGGVVGGAVVGGGMVGRESVVRASTLLSLSTDAPAAAAPPRPSRPLRIARRLRPAANILVRESNRRSSIRGNLARSRGADIDPPTGCEKHQNRTVKWRLPCGLLSILAANGRKSTMPGRPGVRSTADYHAVALGLGPQRRAHSGFASNGHGINAARISSRCQRPARCGHLHFRETVTKVSQLYL
jgi:hypothetical protein